MHVMVYRVLPHVRRGRWCLRNNVHALRFTYWLCEKRREIGIEYCKIVQPNRFRISHKVYKDLDKVPTTLTANTS